MTPLQLLGNKQMQAQLLQLINMVDDAEQRQAAISASCHSHAAVHEAAPLQLLGNKQFVPAASVAASDEVRLIKNAEGHLVCSKHPTTRDANCMGCQMLSLATAGAKLE